MKRAKVLEVEAVRAACFLAGTMYSVYIVLPRMSTVALEFS